MSRRLCMVVHSAFPTDVRVARQVRTAVAAGFSVDVIATRGEGEAAKEQIEGALVYRLPVSHTHGAGLAGAVLEYVSFTIFATLCLAALSLRRRYNVVQVHNPPDFLIVSALVPKLLGASVALDLHDLSSDMFSMRFGYRRGATAAARALRWIERAACGIADRVITVHEPYRRELQERGVPLEKTVVVMNSVDERMLPSPRQAPRREPFRIVYHGTITPHYGLDLLLVAFPDLLAEVPEAVVQIYGAGDAVPALAAQAAELGIQDRVELEGRFLQHTEVLERIQGAAVGVVPNSPTPLNTFALSTKLFEYVVLGIPVVAADLPTLREHFTDAEITFFKAGDAHALCEALLSVAASFDGAQLRAGAARARYDELYSWPKQAQTYVRTLERLAGA